MIRKADQDDLDRIMDIWLYTNLKAHDFIPEDYWRSHFEDVRTAISDAEVYVYDDGGVKGFAGLVENYIAGIFVKEEFQSNGIGGELIRFLQNFKTELCLDVYERNESAVNFYIKHGFQIYQREMEAETNHIKYRMIWNGL